MPDHDFGTCWKSHALRAQRWILLKPCKLLQRAARYAREGIIHGLPRAAVVVQRRLRRAVPRAMMLPEHLARKGISVGGRIVLNAFQNRARKLSQGV